MPAKVWSPRCGGEQVVGLGAPGAGGRQGEGMFAGGDEGGRVCRDRHARDRPVMADHVRDGGGDDGEAGGEVFPASW